MTQKIEIIYMVLSEIVFIIFSERKIKIKIESMLHQLSKVFISKPIDVDFLRLRKLYWSLG